MNITDIQFDWLWIFTLLPLPILIWILLPAAKEELTALYLPIGNLKKIDSHRSTIARSKKPQQFLLLLLWLCLLTAAARPYYMGDAVTLPTQARHLMLAVDLSKSMEEPDMEISGQEVSRIVAVKNIVGKFIEQRRGDKLGLILFADEATLHVPLTFDHKTLKQLLNEAQIGFAGRATAIGDAIGLATKQLAKFPAASRVLILLTDGTNTAGLLDPIKAAKIAQEYGIKVHTIGVGSDSRSSFFGLRQQTFTEINESTLREIAQLTGGEYFRARDSHALEQAYKTLNRIEKIDTKSKTLRPRLPLFQWPLIGAVICSLLLVLSQMISRFTKKQGGLYE